VYFGGKRVARRDASNNSYYYAEDMLGSSRAITTSAGTVCYNADFYPYGGEHALTNTCPQNYKFESKERDAETTNDDFGARFYSSTYGRFLSADWSAVPEPVPYANLTNPQTLNLYAMVSDNPETFADLDGHVWIPCEDAPPPTPQDQNAASPQNQNTTPQQQDQQNNQSNDGGVKAPPPGAPKVPPPPGTGPHGEPNEWVKVDGTGDKQYGPKYKPKYPVPGVSQPQVLWDPHDGWWSHDTGKAGDPRGHYDKWGNKINMEDKPSLMDRLNKIPPKQIQALGRNAIILYLIVSEGSRILFPVRNLVPAP
jgi:RHS repeat-associated protein